MKEKVKNIFVVAIFLVIIFGFTIVNIIAKDKEISESERRKLMQFPKINNKTIFDGKINDQIEEYAMDQFVLRDEFRSIKTFVKLDILHQKDNNDLFELKGSIYKMQYPLNRKSIENTAEKINAIYDKYFATNSNVYYSIVPDKNYYLGNNTVYLNIDYTALENIMKEKVNNNIEYIDIKGNLCMDNYYRTDTHWKQQDILEVRDKIAQNMNFKDKIKTDFISKEFGEFYGTLYGQLGKKMLPDKIEYLTNDILESAKTYNYETKKEGSIYDVKKAKNSMDKYDLFLSGSTPLIEIRNEKAENEKELIIFRDSFGSSLAPLFTEAYSKIILVDTRYMPTEIVGNYIDFNENQDVLFIYSTLLINDSGVLK